MSIVVSCRLSAEEKEHLDSICQRTGRRVGDVIRTILNEESVDELLAEVELRGFMEGGSKWFGKLNVPCTVCGSDFIADFIDDARIRAALLKALSRWGHEECVGNRKAR